MTTASVRPLTLVNRRRLTPCLPRSFGFGRACLRSQRGFGQGAVQRQPRRLDSLEIIVLKQPRARQKRVKTPAPVHARKRRYAVPLEPIRSRSRRSIDSPCATRTRSTQSPLDHRSIGDDSRADRTPAAVRSVRASAAGACAPSAHRGLCAAPHRPGTRDSSFSGYNPTGRDNDECVGS